MIVFYENTYNLKETISRVIQVVFISLAVPSTTTKNEQF